MPVSTTGEQLARRAWLSYFNRVLLDKGVISEREYRQMKQEIDTKPSPREREK